MVIPLLASAQVEFPSELIEKTDGSKKSEKGTFLNIGTEVVVEVEGKTAAELYKLAVNWLNETYKNPDEVIKGQIEGEYIRWQGTAGYSYCRDVIGVLYCDNCRYTTEIRFKDGRFKYEIIEREAYSSPSQYSAGGWYTHPLTFRIANHKGREKKWDKITAYAVLGEYQSMVNRFLDYCLTGTTDDTDEDEW